MKYLNCIKVVIDEEVYELTSDESEEYIQTVAKYIDKKIKELNNTKNEVSTNIKLRSLYMYLNIADDLFKEKEKIKNLQLEIKKLKEESIIDIEKSKIDIEKELNIMKDKHEEEIYKLKKEHEKEILNLKETLNSELELLKKDNLIELNNFKKEREQELEKNNEIELILEDRKDINKIIDRKDLEYITKNKAKIKRSKKRKKY